MKTKHKSLSPVQTFHMYLCSRSKFQLKDILTRNRLLINTFLKSIFPLLDCIKPLNWADTKARCPDDRKRKFKSKSFIIFLITS